MSDDPFPWSVETAESRFLYFDDKVALSRAEEIRLTGRTVEVYHHGKLIHKLNGMHQQNFGMVCDRFLV